MSRRLMRRLMNYIGIDLGTTAVKISLYNDSTPIAELDREYPLITSGSFVEQDPNLWWELIRDGIGELISEKGVCEIYGISMSSQGITVHPVGKDGTALANALSWLDNRAEAEVEEIRAAFGEEKIYEITGKPLLSCYTLPKLRWLSKNKSELVAATDKFLMPLDWINFCLCGRAVTDMSMASGTMMYDINKRDWNDSLLEFAGVRRDQLPEVAVMGQCLGTVHPELSKRWGIEPGTKVVLGGQDQKLSALGAGIGEGIATLSLGTSSAVTFASDNRVEGCARFAFDESTIVNEVAYDTTGAALRWLKRTMNFASYREMDEAAELAAESAGVSFDTRFSTGGAMYGITLGAERGHIVYALYESIAAAIARCFSENDGIDEIRIFGGGSSGELWCRLIAQKTGKKIARLHTKQTAALGAVMLASEGQVGAAGVESYIDIA